MAKTVVFVVLALCLAGTPALASGVVRETPFEYSDWPMASAGCASPLAEGVKVKTDFVGRCPGSLAGIRELVVDVPEQTYKFTSWLGVANPKIEVFWGDTLIEAFVTAASIPDLFSFANAAILDLPGFGGYNVAPVGVWVTPH